jgi:mRNA-degrading endonuclease RelE of RelBE toxin-antitoxin system
MIFPSGQSPSGNIITSGNISPNPPRSRSINDKYSPTGEYNKIETFKMAASRFVEVSDKEISEIKMNSDQKKTQKNLCKNTKTSIRLRLGDYRGIFTSTSSRRIFPDNHLAFGE